MIAGTVGVTVLWLLSQMPASGGPPVPAAPATQAVKEHVGLMCGIAPPASAAEWRARADAIVRVRLHAQMTYEHLESSDVLTAHEGEVLALLKAHPQVLSAGTSMTILQRGGIVARDDGLHRYRWNDFDIMPVGSEWVLFLYWNSYLQGFEVLHFENGAFQILGETIATEGKAPFALKWNGKSVSAFLAALGGTE